MDLPMNVLLPGERLLWSGRPRRIGLGSREWFQLFFGLAWVSSVATIFVRAEGPPWYVGVFFLAAGVAGTFGPLIARYVTIRRAVYAVTDRRVVVADRGSGRTRASAYLGVLAPPIVRAGGDGVGTVTFGEPGGFLTDLRRTAQQPLAAKVELVGVSDAERVRDLIAQAQAAR